MTLVALVSLLFASGLAMLYVVGRHVVPMLTEYAAQSDRTRLLVRCVLPVMLIVPLWSLFGSVRDDFSAVAGAPLAVVVSAAWFGLGAWFLVERREKPPLPSLEVMIAALAGVSLTLLAALGRLTVPVGQCFFAAGAVVLWLHAIVDAPQGRADRSTDHFDVAMWQSFMVMIVQGVLSYQIGRQVGGVLVLFAGIQMLVVGIMLVHRTRRSMVVREMGMWIAVYGVLFGVGLVSLRHVLSTTMEAVSAGSRAPLVPLRDAVASGFGLVAYEGVALAGIGVLMVAGRWSSVRVRRVLGVFSFVVGLMLVVWGVAFQ